MSAPNQNQPGLVASHAQYAKGAAEVRKLHMTEGVCVADTSTGDYWQCDGQ